MQSAYVFSTLGYQAAISYIKSGITESGDPIVDSQEKAAITMAGFAIGKCLFMFAFIKIFKRIGPRVAQYIIWMSCFISLIFHLVISLTLSDKFNLLWAVDGFLWGIQYSSLADKDETEYLNIVTEGDENNSDVFVIMKVFGGIIVFILGAFLRKSISLWLLLVLMITFILLFILTLVNEIKGTKETTMNKVLIPEEAYSKDNPENIKE